MDEATVQGTHANQSGRSGVEVRLQLPAAVRENEPTLIPPGRRRIKDRTRETAEIEPS